ncbi:uncharacterized protein PAC_14784 [Phialocephala subalpina]|uniref:Uncharacterized protein n=1 Tax=Phialocephala subalpina TaxID=576137 RepID=A0A1L7XIN3_9HELO|nr:uncharacterized protein PAC_14784 [Phialocephala subalpina]
MSAPVSAPVSSSAYCFAPLILLLYTADFVLQWRQSKRTLNYLGFRLGIVMIFVIGEVVLVIYDQRHQKQVDRVFLSILQGLSLLQCFCIEVTIWLRMFGASKHSIKQLFSKFSNAQLFFWIVFFYCLAVLGLGAAAFYFFLHGVDDASSRIYLAVAMEIAHSLPTCLSIRYLNSIIEKGEINVINAILYFQLITHYVCLLPLCIPKMNITTFLLCQTAISCLYAILWVSRKLYVVVFKAKPQVDYNRRPTSCGAFENVDWGESSYGLRLSSAPGSV